MLNDSGYLWAHATGFAEASLKRTKEGLSVLTQPGHGMKAAQVREFVASVIRYIDRDLWQLNMDHAIQRHGGLKVELFDREDNLVRTDWFDFYLSAMNHCQRIHPPKAVWTFRDGVVVGELMTDPIFFDRMVWRNSGPDPTTF